MRIPNLDAVGRKITFDEKLPLSMFRAKQCDYEKYLRKKNEVNETVIASQRVSLIPENLALKDLKNQVDTTRVRLCFQVGYNIQYERAKQYKIIYMMLLRYDLTSRLYVFCR